MKNATLTRLSNKLDATLTQFKLNANESGQYPWQEAQEKNRNRRIVAGVAGAAGIGAGAYAAKRGVGALKERYGVASGKDAVTVGAEEARQKIGGAMNQAGQKVKAAWAKQSMNNGERFKAAQERVKTAAAPYVDKLKGGMNQVGQSVQPAVNKVKGAVMPGVNAVKRKAVGAWTAGTRGVAQKQGVIGIGKRVARALIHAEVGKGMPPLVALEAKLDRALGL